VGIVNPLTWTTSEEHAPADANMGGVLTGFKVYPHVTDAAIYRGILWCRKPKFKGSALYWSKNYHPGDFNLYYFNVRTNAQDRAAAFLRG
jgi:hypothetical protein